PVGVETHLFRNGGIQIVALLTNPELRVDEMGPPEFKSNDRFAKTRELKLSLPQEMFVYDVRAAKVLGKEKEVTVRLEPYEPAIFAVSPVAFSDLDVMAPLRMRRGETVHIG